MSVFDEILVKLHAISNDYVKSFNEELEAINASFDKFEEEYFNDRIQREKTLKDKKPLTTLQSINEDEDESKSPKDELTIPKPVENGTSSERSSNDSNSSQRATKKRSKNEVDGIDSPKQEKRLKRTASAKASANISKQVNLNLNQKLRRDVTLDKAEKVSQSSTSAKQKDDDKENLEPMIPISKIKQEKISLSPKPMDEDPLPLNLEAVQKDEKDAIAMPPPVAPLPKPRKLVKEKTQEEANTEEVANVRRSTRTRKQSDLATLASEARSVRSSNRSKPSQAEEKQPEETDVRPKRTRAKKLSGPKKVSSESEETQESLPHSPADKPRPKRTRRALKAMVKEDPKPVELISPKEEKLSLPEVRSPILQNKTKQKDKKTDNPVDAAMEVVESQKPSSVEEAPAIMENEFEETKIIPIALNATMTISNHEMDKTMVLTNGVYNHLPIVPVDNNTNTVNNMNETMVLEKLNEDDKPLVNSQNVIMNATVVIEKGVPDSAVPEITGDNSLLTNDSDPDFEPQTPPKQSDHVTAQPTSAVKEKVQQFEELASRVTRTKTRAMAKKEQENDNQTPPDKVSKAVISAETLAKMNSMIFNGKPLQQSHSASKPRPVVPSIKTASSASKLSAINKAREADDGAAREKEDARRKKEAMLEAKREMHRKKREEKMAAAAAARDLAERERRLAVEALEKGRREKQAHADRGKVDRLKEAERKKQEQAKKMAEMEERRRAEEQARQARLEEQRKAEALRKKQLEEAEAMKKEAAITAKEIEKRKKEYIEKQKMRHNRHDDKMHTPLKTTASSYVVEPVYMLDGFQYLNSDEDEDDNEPVLRPMPEWSTSKARHLQLAVQTQVSAVHIDRLFSVRVHTPDLREIFPNIDRSRLKRTSSAVWRTPPNRLPAVAE